MNRLFALCLLPLSLSSATAADPFGGLKRAFEPLGDIGKAGGSGIKATIDVFKPGNVPSTQKYKRDNSWDVFIQTTPHDGGHDSFEFREKWYGANDEAGARRMAEDLMNNKAVFIKWKDEKVYKLKITDCPNTKRDHWWVRCNFTYSYQF